MFKKILKKIKRKFLMDFIYNHKFIRLVHHAGVIKRYMANGIYVVGKNTYEQSMKTRIKFGLRKFSLKDFGSPVLIICSAKRKKAATCDSAEVYFRKVTNKMVFCFDENVVSFYGIGNVRLSKIEKYIGECNYPRCEYYETDTKKYYNVCSFVKGEWFSKRDVATKQSIIEQLLGLNANAVLRSAGEFDKTRTAQMEKYGLNESPMTCGYVQHGDLNVSNIVCNDEKFYLIDFDNIGVYPPLFDFFRLISFNQQLFQMFIDGVFDKRIAAVLEHCNGCVEKDFKDKYLAIYLAVCKTWFQKIKVELLPDDYVKSKAVYTDKIANI